jgi:hypothetical protein
MVAEKLPQIVRQFSQNGLKLLLENPLNVVDLLGLSAPDIVGMFDPGQLKTVQATFVQSDYRHVESDVVLVAPLRHAKRKRLLRRLLIYVLIEHQSQPDRLMPLRALDYVVQIFRYQVREWSKTHRSFSRIRFDPVLPAAISARFCGWSSSGDPGPASSNRFWIKWSSTWRRCRKPNACAGWKRSEKMATSRARSIRGPGRYWPSTWWRNGHSRDQGWSHRDVFSIGAIRQQPAVKAFAASHSQQPFQQCVHIWLPGAALTPRHPHRAKRSWP